MFIDDSGGPMSGWPLSITAPETHEDKVVVRTGGQWPYEWDASTSQVEAVANAQLIAASPTMHQALRVFIRAFELEHPGVENKDEDWVYDEHRSVGLAYLQALSAIHAATGEK